MSREQILRELRWVELTVHPDRIYDMRLLARQLLEMRYPGNNVAAYRKVHGGRVGAYVIPHLYHVHPDDIDHMKEQAAMTMRSPQR